MTTMSRFAGVVLAAVALTGCPLGGPCGGGNPNGPNPPNCGPTSMEVGNVDCSFCCMLTGQSCTAAQNTGVTTTDPCCSGTCANGRSRS